jgi:hypothetical protein
VIFSFSGREEEEEKKGREREGEEKSSFSLSCSASLQRVHTFYLLLCPIALFFCSLLLIERVFVWQASVKYETDQSTLDFVSEQTMHPFNEKIYNPTHRLHLL